VASPTVTGTAVTTTGGTASATPSILLPATVNAGDYIVALIRESGAEAFTWPDGWNVLLSDSSDGSDDQTECAYKIADGSEGGTSITLSRTTSGKYSALSYAIGLCNAIGLGGLATGASTTPDPLTYIPLGGAITGVDYIWLWMGGWEGEQTSPPATPPTNYTNLIGSNSGIAGATATNNRVASARRFTSATTENPPAMTISASDDWTAFVVALWIQPPPTLLPVTVKPRFWRWL